MGVGVCGTLLVIFLRLLKFKLLWLLSIICYGVIYAMEEAQNMCLTNLWLECDSALVSGAFTARTKVQWILSNRWNTCLNYYGKIRFWVTYIFREGNACADKLANLEFILTDSFHWYNRLPCSLFLEFFINKYSLPIYHFC